MGVKSPTVATKRRRIITADQFGALYEAIPTHELQLLVGTASSVVVDEEPVKAAASEAVAGPGSGVGPFGEQGAVEPFCCAVGPGLTGWDERQTDPFAGPVSHRCADELWAVVTAQHGRIATLGGEAVLLIDEQVRGRAGRAADGCGGCR
jgi:hypothetical protein